jgi:hypothetical protein
MTKPTIAKLMLSLFSLISLPVGAATPPGE